MFKEFREFAVRGNALDLAIGVLIGAAFGAVVASLVSGVSMPPIGLLLGGPSLDAAKEAGAPLLAYGNFVNTPVNFLIVAFAIFLVVMQVNRFKKPVPVEDAPSTKDCPHRPMSIPARATRCPRCTYELGVMA